MPFFCVFSVIYSDDFVLGFVTFWSVTTDSNSSTFRLFRSTFANIRAQAKQFDAAPSFASAADSINPVTSYQGFREAVDVGSGVCTCVFSHSTVFSIRLHAAYAYPKSLLESVSFTSIWHTIQTCINSRYIQIPKI